MTASRLIVPCVVSLVCHAASAATASPGGRVEFALEPRVEGAAFAVKLDKRIVAHVRTCAAACAPTGAPVSVSRVWKPVWGDRSEIRDAYVEEVFAGEYGEGRRVLLEVRAYDEGFAFRYRLPDGGEFAERTTVDYPAESRAWAISKTEGTYPEEPAAIVSGADEWLTPLTVVGKGGFSSFFEAYAVSYPRMRVKPQNGSVAVKLLQRSSPVLRPGGATPWRVLQLGATAAELVENSTLVLNLNPPCEVEDVSWIRPGLAFSNLANCPLREERLEEAADADSRNNFRYAQIDWGWYGTEWLWTDAQREVYAKTNPEFKDEPTWRENTRSSLRRVAKGHVPYLPGWVRYTWVDFDLPRYVDFLEKRGMGLWLYARGAMLEEEDLESLFALYRSWGVKGIKPGFVRYGDAASTDWIREVVRVAAKHRLLVDVHDLYVSDGLERTYPNLMLSEGGGGEEGCHPVRQDVTLPFTRCLAGPFDFTPKFFRPGASHAHMAAMLLVYPGATAIVRGISSARFGKDRVKGWEVWGPERDFVKSLPMTYDETHVLEGEIAKHVAVAKRQGSTWYIAGVNGKDARTVNVPLDFLSAGKTYRCRLVRDDMRTSAECRMARVEELVVTSKDCLEVQMDAAGGFAATLTCSPK